MSYTGVTGQLVGELSLVAKVNVQENKDITPSASQQVVEPDNGYDAMAQVTVEAVSLQNKNVTPAVGQQVVEPSEGYVGLAKVTVAATPLESNKTITPTTSQQVVEPSQGYIGLKKVTVRGATDQFNTLMMADGGQITLNIDMGTGSNCHGFFNGNSGYGLTITGGRGSNKSISAKAFTYQKYLKSVTADEIKYMSNGDEFSYSGLTTGHFAALQELNNNTFRGCTDIRHLYFGYAGVVGGTLIGGRIFNGKSSGTVDIHVPADQLSAYQADSTWTDIISAEASAGVTVNLVGDYA